MNKIKSFPGNFVGNVHLFNCLVSIRHAEFKTDRINDVMMTDISVWCIGSEGDLWDIIRLQECDVLRRLLCLGLDVNQRIQFTKSHVNSLLHSLIDELYVSNRLEKVRILLEAGADVNILMRYRQYPFVLKRMRDRKYDSVLNIKGVSALERIKRLMCENSESKYQQYRVLEYKKVMCEINKHVKIHSV